jgi:hypothetical protein
MYADRHQKTESNAFDIERVLPLSNCPYKDYGILMCQAVPRAQEEVQEGRRGLPLGVQQAGCRGHAGPLPLRTPLPFGADHRIGRGRARRSAARIKRVSERDEA